MTDLEEYRLRKEIKNWKTAVKMLLILFGIFALFSVVYNYSPHGSSFGYDDNFTDGY